MSKPAFISPDFFSVAPELIGRPLSGAGRRALAMLVDLILIALLVKAGGVFLGLAAAFLLLRASRPGEAGGFIRHSVRFALRAFGAVLLLVVAMKLWNFGERSITGVNDDGDDSATEAESSTSLAALGNLNLNFAPRDAGNAMVNIAGLASAEEPSAVRDHARKLLAASKRAGATNAQLHAARRDLIELMDEPDSTRVAAFDEVLAEVAGPAPMRLSGTDSLQAVIAQLNRAVDVLDDSNDSLRKALTRARKSRGVLTYIGGFLDDLGLGFGWAAIYFTGFLAMMRGQTPGKRVIGIRVIRLDGKPLGWWISFERFGGYAASLSVGLLGFFQILWDRNRQGLHDKACETVVVLDNLQAAARS